MCTSFNISTLCLVNLNLFVMTVSVHSSGKTKCLVCSTKRKLGKPGVYFVVFTIEWVSSNLSKFTVKLIESFLRYSHWSWRCLFCGTIHEVGICLSFPALMVKLAVSIMQYSLRSWWCLFCGTNREVGIVYYFQHSWWSWHRLFCSTSWWCVFCGTHHEVGGVFFVVLTVKLVVCFWWYSMWCWWCVFCGTHCEVSGV